MENEENEKFMKYFLKQNISIKIVFLSTFPSCFFIQLQFFISYLLVRVLVYFNFVLVVVCCNNFGLKLG